jgi:hypothetical protein
LINIGFHEEPKRIFRFFHKAIFYCHGDANPLVSIWISLVGASFIAFSFVEIIACLAHATKFNGTCQTKHTFFDGLLAKISISVDN